jgi:hypothetical protein
VDAAGKSGPAEMLTRKHRQFALFFSGMRKRMIAGLLAASLSMPFALLAQQAKTPAPVAPPDSLLLKSGDASASLSSPDFHALPHVTITVHNSHSNADETYSGVPLSALLAKINAPTGKDLRGEAMTSYLIATGSDGYAVVLSLAEVDPGFRDSQVIVADARDGQSLGKNGPFQLIVPEDKRPARWVHNLVSITLKRAD